MSVAGEGGCNGMIPSTHRFGTALADIFRCGQCGHMQVHPMPHEAVLQGAYTAAASQDYVEEEAGQRHTAHRVLAQIERHSASPGRLLDLGCWVGFLLAAARQRGWEVLGVEPSEFASTYARDQLGLEVITSELLTAPLQHGIFDAVTMGDVVEHLPHPGAALDRVRELLAPEGVLWLALPDAGSRVARVMGKRWWSVIPTHVHYFTRDSITVLLGRHGYEVLEIGSSPKAFTVRYYLERIEGYSQLAGRTLSRAAIAAGIADRMWAPDFHDRMALVARLSEH